MQDKDEKFSEYLSLRKDLENAVHARNELKEELINILQSQASYSKAAEFSKRKAVQIVHHIAVLVRKQVQPISTP